MVNPFHLLPTQDRPKTWFVAAYLLLALSSLLHAVLDLPAWPVWTAAFFVLGTAWALIFFAFCDLYRRCEPWLRTLTAFGFSLVVLPATMWAAGGAGTWAREVRFRQEVCRSVREEEARRIELDRPADPASLPWLEACEDRRFLAGFGEQPGYQEASLSDFLGLPVARPQLGLGG